MIFDIKKVFANEQVTIPVDFSFDMSNEEIDGIYPISSDVKVKGDISNSSGIIKINYTVDFSYTRPCDRCATVTTREMSYLYEHIIVSSLAGEDTGDYVLVEDYHLDAIELVKTDILLDLPLKYLCRDDCKGVCPKCGIDKNVGTCKCSTKTVDPRLEALQQLLDN